MFGRKEIIKQETIDKSLIKNWIACLVHTCKGDIFRVKEKLVYNIKDRFIWTNDTESFINQEINKVWEEEYYE